MQTRVRINGRRNLMVQLRVNLWFWAIVIGLPTITSLLQQTDGLALYLYNEFAIKLWELFVVLCVGILFVGGLALLISTAAGAFLRVDTSKDE